MEAKIFVHKPTPNSHAWFGASTQTCKRQCSAARRAVPAGGSTTEPDGVHWVAVSARLFVGAAVAFHEEVKPVVAAGRRTVVVDRQDDKLGLGRFVSVQVRQVEGHGCLQASDRRKGQSKGMACKNMTNPQQPPAHLSNFSPSVGLPAPSAALLNFGLVALPTFRRHISLHTKRMHRHRR